MPTPFFIVSKLTGGLVIDIQGASTKPGTLLDAFTKKTKSPDWNNQLWEFVPSVSTAGSYVLQNPASSLVIDIEGAKTKPGTPLDAFTLTITGKLLDKANAPNQLWTFIPSTVAGYYFIQGDAGLVIDVEGASTKPGTPLDAFTKKTKSPDWDNQLWTFVDENGNSVTPPPPYKPPPPPKFVAS